MVDDRLDDPADPLKGEPGRAKRPPPTLDLSPNEEPGGQPEMDAAAEPVEAPAEPARRSGLAASAGTGALAGALVAGLAWFAASTWLTATPEPQPATVSNVNAARIDDLTSRLAKLEARPLPTAPTPSAAPDLSRITARLDALESSAAALREQNAALRAQADKALSAASEAQKDASATAPAAAPDLSGITGRLTQLEATAQSQSARIAEQARRPLDDSATRRIAAASLLDAQVRAGEPYAAALGAATTLAPDAAKLGPLQPFATTGVPSANALARALLELPQIVPPPTATSGGLIDRIRTGAAKLVKIERTDAANTDNAIFVRAAEAARRDDLATAAKELTALAPADRAAVQPWLDRVAAREAARAASRQFANEALAAMPQTPPKTPQAMQ